MTDDEGFDVGRLAELLERVGEDVTGVKRIIVGDDDGDEGLVELAEDLWEVLEETEELLETLDFEELPDAIDVEELPEAVDLEAVPEGLFDEEKSAIDLTDLHEAINLRELWDAVDLTRFLQEKRELEDAVDDVTDNEGDDEEDDEMFENVVETEGVSDQFSQQARQAYIEEKILAAAEKFRSALLSTHDGLRKIYRANQEKLGQEGNQPDSLNPSAVSTMPPGPIPDSISTRTSTVPKQVRYSRVENPRRIYGRRFDEHRDDSSDSGPEAEDESEEADVESDAATASKEAEAETADEEAPAETDADGESDTDDADDGVPKIEVFEGDD